MRNKQIDELLKDETTLAIFESRYTFDEDVNELTVYRFISDLVYWGIDFDVACDFCYTHFNFEDRDEIETWDMGISLYNHAIEMYHHRFTKLSEE